ncbi:MAG: hypothetical protein AB1611_13090 [bacterium]
MAMMKIQIVLFLMVLMSFSVFHPVVAAPAGYVPGVAETAPEDIKDIKPPLEMKRNWAPYWKALLWGGLVAAALLLAWWGIHHYWKKKVSRVSDEEITPLPAHEAALAELTRLWNDFKQDGKIKEFYFRLSEIIRQYLARRYQINALEATTEELLHDLRDQPLQVQHRMLISDFLSGCDLVKFAKYIPQMEETEHRYRMAYEIIDHTRPADSSSREAREDIPVRQGQQAVELK